MKSQNKCTTCKKEDIVDWDDRGNCIRCARNNLLGPEKEDVQFMSLKSQNNLNYRIAKKGYGKTEFAEMLGISPQHLSKLCSGKNNPSLKLKQKIDNLLSDNPAKYSNGMYISITDGGYDEITE